MRWLLLVSMFLSACLLETDVHDEADATADEVELGVSKQAIVSRQIFEDPGRAYAVELRECWEYDDSPAAGQTGLERWWYVPSYVTDATVILNGFAHAYKNGDHHIRNAGAQVSDVSLEGSLVRFRFKGSLSDQNGDDPVRLCWQATVLGWSDRAIDATRAFSFKTETVHTDVDGDGIYRTSLSGGCSFGAGATAFVVPRGFVGGYYDGSDHHLYQFAHHVSQDTAPGACISFDISGLIQDNQQRQNYWQSWASLVVGSGVRVQTSPFSFAPRGTHSNCIVPTGGERVQHRIVNNLPYDYAVPVLTGFRLGFSCDDEHVEHLGASVRNASWNAATHTLEYDEVSYLADDDNWPGHQAGLNVSVLGLVRTGLADSLATSSLKLENAVAP